MSSPPVSAGGRPGRIGPFASLSPARRAASLRATLDDVAGDSPVWLFAYGSLMWDPCFAYDSARTGTLAGYQRRFTIWTALARGTPERPGLGLALEPGDGRCRGRVFRISAETRAAGLAALWEREMETGIYRPEWLEVTTAEGALRALCFVAEPGHPQYAGAFSRARTADIIAGASGKFGSCADYLAETVTALAAAGIADDGLAALLSLVKQRLSRDP